MKQELLMELLIMFIGSGLFIFIIGVGLYFCMRRELKQEAKRTSNRLEDLERTKRILEKLLIIWDKYPSFTLIHLLIGLSKEIKWKGTDLYNFEDSALETCIDKHLGKGSSNIFLNNKELKL